MIEVGTQYAWLERPCLISPRRAIHRRQIITMNHNDNPLVHEAQKRLGGSSHLFLRHVHCHAETGELFLDGKVPSYFLKQTAQSLIQSIEGVDRVVNRLRVVNAWGAPVDDEADLPTQCKTTVIPTRAVTEEELRSTRAADSVYA